MLYALIAAALIAGLLIGFALLAVIWMSGKVTSSIRGRALELISSYDLLIAGKSEKLSEIEKRIKEEETALIKEEPKVREVPVSEDRHREELGSLVHSINRMSNVEYQSSAVADTYQLVRSSCTTSLREACERILALHEKSVSEEKGTAGRLLRELGFDLIYRMSELPAETQYELLMNSLDEDGKQLLELYSDGAHFSVLAFYNHLTELAHEETGRLRIRIAPGYTGDTQIENAEITVDDQLCEGFRIEYDHVLYDYSITKKDLS